MGIAKSLLSSKKVWVMIIGVLVIILNRTLDLGLTGEDLAMVGGANIATILGIGMADFKKESSKALAAPKPADPR